MFSLYVHQNRYPAGRTPDITGRHHGAVYYLDARWEILRNDKKNPGRSSFCVDFTVYCANVTGYKVAERTTYQWFIEYFVSRAVTDVTVHVSSEQTTFYPHKTDACARS